ncbi:MAG: hypothetical protein Q9210_004959 [Variospora velana]
MPLARNDSAATLAAPANLEKGDSFRILPLSQASTSTRWLDVTQPVKMHTMIIYPVPGTTTRLIIKVWEDKLPKLAMSEVISQTMNFAVSHIEAHGDGFLEPRDDPFWLDRPDGVVFGLWSSDRTRHLTYQELGNTAKGLWEAMFMETKYNAASVSVYDKTSSARIGSGVIRAGHVQYQVSDS